MCKHGCFAIRRVTFAAYVGVLACLVGGCSSETGSTPVSASIKAAPPATQAAAPAISPQGQPKETWDALYLAGAKVGYSRTTISDDLERGVKLVRVDSTSTVTVNRSGQRHEQTMISSCIETATGDLVRFHTMLKLGSTPTDFRGHVEGNELVIETNTAGKSTTLRQPWPAGAGGLMALEQSLLRQPMRAGERRVVTGLMAVVNQPVTIELTAEKSEPTRLLQHSEDLLRVECRAKLPDGKPIVERLWINTDGVILKRQLDALKQETYRSTKEFALADVGSSTFDLTLDTTVPVNRPLDDPHATRRVRYRVELKTNEPAQVFVQGTMQTVTLLDQRVAEVVVRAMRPKLESESAESATPAASAPTGTPVGNQNLVPTIPTDDDRGPNNLIQSDNPKIVSMARSIAADETDVWTIATRLERAVKEHVRRPNYAQAFASAADVVEHGEGDCTEHAVLLAALCRARGIPARVAIGLVYVSPAQGFGYHMWNEVWIGDQWIPLDATLGRGGIGAAHLKLADSNLQGTNAFGTFLAVAQVIGQLKIEILDVE